MVDGPKEVTADTKKVLNGSVHREKPLRLGSGFEAAHLTLPLAGRLMRDFCSIVFVLPGTVDHGRHHGAVRRRVAAQLVGDESSRLAALSFQQLAEEPNRRPPIAPRLYQDVDHVPVLVDGPPQVLLPALNPHEQLIEIPRVALPATPAPQPSSVLEPEGQAPLPDCLVRDRDSALGEEILDVSETEAESMIQPHCVTDDLGRKSVSSVGRRLLTHPLSLRRTPQPDSA